MSSNYYNAVTFKKIIKSKFINHDQSHSSSQKHIKITENQKLTNSIYAVVEKLRFFYEKKIEPIEQAVK